MKLKELRGWIGRLDSDDHVDIINGNTLTASRNGVIVDSLNIGGTAFADCRKQCYKEFREGIKPLEDILGL